MLSCPISLRPFVILEGTGLGARRSPGTKRGVVVGVGGVVGRVEVCVTSTHVSVGVKAI